MASSLKGLGGIKGLLLLHGEKIAITIVGLLALWLMYKSTTLPRLEEQYQADKLASAVTATTNEVRDFTWDKAVAEHPDKVKIAKLVVKNDFTVDFAKYQTSPELFDRVVIAPTVLRTDPTLDNAVDVWATGGSGLFAFIDEKIRKAQELARAREAAEQAKKEEDRLKREAEQQADGAPGRGRGPDGDAGVFDQVMDPAHPTRRSVEGMARPTGVPLQGGERIERKYWATVVAKVPIREQLKHYQDAFEKARLGFDPARDFPQYKGYMVQCAEVVRGKPLEWKAVPLYDGQQQSILANKPIHPSAVGLTAIRKLYEAATLFWAGQTSDVVDERFLDPVLTLPLPPLVGRDWGSEATHPDIPLLINTPPLEEETVELAEQTPAEPAETDENAAFRSDDATQFGPGQFGQAPGRSSGRIPGGPGGFRGEHEPGGPRGRGMMYGPEGGAGRRGFAGGGPEGGRVSRGGGMSLTGGVRTSLPRGVDFLLLRFFDFTVEPGKRYKYRVKLVLADPNFGVDENALAPAVLDRQRKEGQAAKASGSKRPDFRLLENWSEPSPTVGIPLAGSVRLAEAKVPPPEKFNDEPLATLLVQSFDLDEEGNAIQAAVEKEFRRGYVANMIEKNVKYLGPDGTWFDTMDSFKFLTGMIVLDLDGGEKLTKTFNTPARMLLMGPAGELYIRNEVDDKSAVEQHRLIFDDKAKRRGGRPEDGMMPEFPGAGARGRGER